MSYEVKRFDDAQWLVLRVTDDGRKELIANCTSDTAEADAHAIVTALRGALTSDKHLQELFEFEMKQRKTPQVDKGGEEG